jgi:hypothetical protein
MWYPSDLARALHQAKRPVRRPAGARPAGEIRRPANRRPVRA